MSQQDHNSSNQGLFAGRRVTVVQPDTLSRDRLVGQLSVLRYQDAGVITSQQMDLLQRLLPRTRLESLLESSGSSVVWTPRFASLAKSCNKFCGWRAVSDVTGCNSWEIASIWLIAPCCGTGCSTLCIAGGCSVWNRSTAFGATSWYSCR